MSVFLSSFKIGAISGHLPDGNVSLIFRINFQKFYPVYYSVFFDIVRYKNFPLPLDLSC